MPVAQVTDRTPLKAGHIYVIPPNAFLSISRGLLRLTPRPEGRSQHARFLQVLYNVKPELCYVNYREAFQHLIARHPKRALTMVFTDLLDSVISAEYQGAVGLLKRFHWPLTLAVADVPLTGPVAREWIHSAHIVWDHEQPEFIAEFANVTHNPVGGAVSSNSQAFYAQTAYRLPWFQKALKPYYRFDYMHVPRSDLDFKSIVPVFHSSTVGLRYDITSFAAFKMEYRDYTRRDLPSVRGFFTQTSFTF